MAQDVKRRTRDDPAVRRAQILDEAIRIIGERGYYGFAVQDLAARCGLTTGGLLYHFNTKEVLLLAVLGDYERRIEAALEPLIDSFPQLDVQNDTLSRAAALALLRAIMEQAVAEPELACLFIVLQAEALHHTHPAYDFFCAHQARFLSMVPRIVAAHSAEPASTARQLSALMLGLQHQWLRADRTFDVLAEWDRAVARILPEKDTK